MPSTDFISGSIAAVFFVGAMFFLRFWTRTRDVLFGGFAGAFFLLALGQVLTAVLALEAEERTWIYLMRLAAFVTIIISVVRKNMAH